MHSISAEDWMGMYGVASRRAEAAEAEVKRLRAELAATRPAMRPIPTTPIAVGAPMPPPPDECASVTERQLRAELQVLREASRWIPVSERLPAFGQDGDDGAEIVDVWANGRRVPNCFRSGDNDGWGWYEADPNDEIEGVTHWRPLPEGPC